MLLNPVLYAAISQCYGEVRVVRPGESGAPPHTMTDPRTLRKYARWFKGEDRGEEYACCCPFCGDSGFHLYINYRHGTRDAFGRMIWAANCYKGCLDKNPKNREKLNASLLFGTVRNPSANLRQQIQARCPPRVFTAPSVLRGVVPLTALPDSHPAVQYILNRGYDRQTMQEYSLGYCTSDELFMTYRRLIIPIRFKGEQISWQARRLDDSARGPKYYLAPGISKSRFLYNYDVARMQPFVVVAEGVTDVWRIGAPGVCIFGKTLAAEQARLICETWSGKPVVVLLDPEAREEAHKLTEMLKKSHNGKVVDVVVPGEDPDRTSADVLSRVIEEGLNDS